MHIHGFMKIGHHEKGPVGFPKEVPETDTTPQFERKVRGFFKKFIPDLAEFTEMEGKVCYYTNTKDDDFILDRLPDAPNAFLGAGFSGHGFKFAPLVGKTLAELSLGGKPEINLHRFRAHRFGKG
jgi:glycine/D-amino acid oxidase-like deaminating enzyme